MPAPDVRGVCPYPQVPQRLASMPRGRIDERRDPGSGSGLPGGGKVCRTEWLPATGDRTSRARRRSCVRPCRRSAQFAVAGPWVCPGAPAGGSANMRTTRPRSDGSVTRTPYRRRSRRDTRRTAPKHTTSNGPVVTSRANEMASPETMATVPEAHASRRALVDYLATTFRNGAGCRRERSGPSMA